MCLDDVGAIASVANVLQDAVSNGVKGGRGPITFCVLDPAELGEVDVTLNDEFPVSPQIKGALRSLGGVLDVQEL